MEYALSQQALQSGANLLNEKLEKVNYNRIRKYFDIYNSYVIEKIGLLIFPFYRNEISFGPSIYRPDMYIPAMSFITIVLLKGIILGLANKFHPEILIMSFSRTLLIHIGLNLIYKLAAYFFDVPTDLLDLICFTGYKFFIITIVKLFNFIIFGKFLSLYFFVAYFFFLSRSFKSSFVGENSHSSNKNIYLLFGIVSFDIIVSLFFSFY